MHWRIFPHESEKKVLVPRTQEKKKQKKRHKEQFVPPQNRRFPLSTMVTNIHLWALFRDVIIASSWL
jgi:hypothetical protein